MASPTVDEHHHMAELNTFPPVAGEKVLGERDGTIEEKEEAMIGTMGALPELDRKEEKRVVRKMDMHLIPLVMMLYLFSYLDRINIGNARYVPTRLLYAFVF
jgi:hypothetical protein